MWQYPNNDISKDKFMKNLKNQTNRNNYLTFGEGVK